MTKRIRCTLLVRAAFAGALISVPASIIHAAPAKSTKSPKSKAELAAEARFITAIEKGDVAQIKAYLAKNPQRLNSELKVDYGSESPLSFAAVSGNWESFQFLLQSGAKLNKKTIMTHAGMGGNLKIARTVADKGADPNAMDFMGRTALWHVAYRNDVPKAKFFLALGVSPDAGQGTNDPMTIAIEGDHVAMVQLLLSKGARISPYLTISDPKMKELVDAAIKGKPRNGEILLSGAIASIDLENDRMVLNATAFTVPSGKSSTIAPAKAKSVALSDKVRLYRNAQTEALQLSDLQVGDAITVIGPDDGSGKQLTAREITVLASRPANAAQPTAETETLAAVPLIPSTYQADMGNLPASAPYVSLSRPAALADEDAPADAAFEIEIVSLKATAKLSPTREILLYANPGKNFKVELTAKFKAPVPTKLASNLLLADAKILSPEAEMELGNNHAITQHFDTQSRAGYQAVEGEGTMAFDLIGTAPTEKGQYNFNLNVGLFDKATWATKTMKLYNVTLITDQQLFDQVSDTAATTVAPVAAPPVVSEAAGLPEIARFDFNGNGQSLQGDAEFRLKNTELRQSALYVNGEFANYDASGFDAVAVPATNYDSFTVALRFKAESFDKAFDDKTLVMAGALYRWFGLRRAKDGSLEVTFNNGDKVLPMPDVRLEAGKWTTLTCSVDIVARTVLVTLNDDPTAQGGNIVTAQLPQDFALEVKEAAKGNPAFDKSWTFTDYGSGNTFHGLVDELVIYSRALTFGEMEAYAMGAKNLITR